VKVKALRGCCIGVDRHLKVGDTTELDPATSQYLVSIKAVEEFKDEPAKHDPKSESAPAEKAGKSKEK
jgi:hypothetical protein